MEPSKQSLLGNGYWNRIRTYNHICRSREKDAKFERNGRSLFYINNPESVIRFRVGFV